MNIMVRSIADRIGGDESTVMAVLMEYWKRNDELYAAALKKWGKDFQFAQAIEELAELIVELRKFSRGRATIKDVMLEVADVRIMCDQIHYIFQEMAKNSIEGSGISDMNAFYSQNIEDQKLRKLMQHLGWNNELKT